jgi:serine/threonine protein kinase/Flp pilus assembly protein TadD
VTAEFECADSAADVLSEAAQDRLARILDDYLVAAEQGMPITPEELVRRHPDDAKYLRHYLSGLQVFHAAAAELKPRPPSYVGRLEPAQVIGDFRLLREIGRGGMGIVYEALQISLQRRVALKILPFTAGHDEKQIHRFRNEALAAAHVEHAHIVPVYAVGEDNGVHFYAMQLIEGQSLMTLLADVRPAAAIRTAATTAPNHQRTTWGNQIGNTLFCAPMRSSTPPMFTHSGDTNERIRKITRLGIQAAEALHAAHEIGIVHRDVKPSNLLVDAQGKLWVTDFGLARCREQGGLTQTGDVLGTMRYMSPEQALGRGRLIDHRTDVYSLGITLYELVTGHHPAGDSSDAQLVLHRGEFHHKPMRHWNARIPRDFETVVMKAIAEFPYERYATAQEFSDDLQRFLDGKPILASPPSLVNRAGKWARRHRSFVYVAAAVVLLASAVGSINSLLLIQNNREKDQALAASRTSLHSANTVLDFFSTQLVDQLVTIPGAEGVRYQLLEESLEMYRQFEAHAVGDDTLADDLALAYGKMGTLSEKIGNTSEALVRHQAACDLWQARTSAEPSNAEYALNLATCQNNVGLLLANTGRGNEALESLHKAQNSLEKLTATRTESAGAAAALATTYSNLGFVLRQRGDSTAAAKRFCDAIAIQERLVDQSRKDESVLRGLAASYNNLASLSEATAPDAAIATYKKAIGIQKRLVKNWPMNRIYQAELARTYNNLGFVLVSGHDLRNGEACYRNAVTLQENLVMASKNAACYRRDLAISYNNLGMAQCRFERLDNAEKSFQRALALQQPLIDAAPEEAKLHSDMGGIYNNLALLFDRLQRFADAKSAYEHAIIHQRRAFEISPDVSRYRELLQNHYANLVKFLRSQNKQPEADEFVQERETLFAGHR